MHLKDWKYLTALLLICSCFNKQPINHKKYSPYKIDYNLCDNIFFSPLHKDTIGIAVGYSGQAFQHFIESDSEKYYIDSINKMSGINYPKKRNDFLPNSRWLETVTHCKCTLDSTKKMIMLEAPFFGDSAKNIDLFLSFSPDTSFATTINQTGHKLNSSETEITELTFAEEPEYIKGDTIYGKFSVKVYDKKPARYVEIWSFFKCVIE